MGLNGGASGTESLPQLVTFRFRQPGPILLLLLPAGENVVKRNGYLLPLGLGGVPGGERLNFGHQGSSFRDRVFDRGLVLCNLLLGELANCATQRFEPGVKRCEIADSVRRQNGLHQGGHRLGDVGRWSATFDSLLEKSHLSREVGELALEICERLFWRAVRVLPDGAFTAALAHEDGSRLVDATPWCLIVRSQSLTLLAGDTVFAGDTVLKVPGFSLLHDAQGRISPR